MSYPYLRIAFVVSELYVYGADMGVKVTGTEKGSPAEKKHIKAGDILLKINGNEINDFLDYRFYAAEKKTLLELADSRGKTKKVKIKKGEYDDLGLQFDSFIMDKERSCANGCIFCFIDQLPPGLRKSLYFKDDDSRLSFLFGNYMTLTNISEKEIDRIIKMHISPINISVHTMNPELRVKMMKNKRAGKVLEYLPALAAAGVNLNAQLVLCPGINDGDELRYSLNELEKLIPALQSVAAVPVGLTDYREGLYKIEPYTREGAREVVEICEQYGNKFKEKYGSYIIRAADEFYLKAGMQIPPAEVYEDYSQLENGVGLWALMRDEFEEAVRNFAGSDKTYKVTLATGKAAAPLMQYFVDLLKEKCYNVNVNIAQIENNFFGHNITVSGLLTGSDLISQLKGKNLGDRLIIPAAMLKRDEDIFLDDVTLDELKQTLGVEVVPAGRSGEELLNALIGE